MSKLMALVAALILTATIGVCPPCSWGSEQEVIPFGIGKQNWRAFGKDAKSNLSWLQEQQNTIDKGVLEIGNMRKTFIDNGYPKDLQPMMIAKLKQVFEVRNGIANKTTEIYRGNVAHRYFLTSLDYATGVSCILCMSVASAVAKSGDKDTAKSLYRDVIVNFDERTQRACVKQAEFALEDLKANAN